MRIYDRFNIKSNVSVGTDNVNVRYCNINQVSTLSVKNTEQCLSYSRVYE